MAKFGYLVLNRGKWGDKQIVPDKWVQTSTRKHIAAATLQDGYGYQWWISDADYYMALGYKGQFIFVVPKRNLVAVFTGNLDDDDFYVPQNLLDEFIIPAAKASVPLPEDPDGMALLAERTEALTKARYTE